MDDDLPYRTPFSLSPFQQGAANASKEDQANYNTLIRVRDEFKLAIEGLSKDYNAFNILNANSTKSAKDKLVFITAGKQIAYDILSPQLEALETAIRDINEQWKVR